MNDAGPIGGQCSIARSAARRVELSNCMDVEKSAGLFFGAKQQVNRS